jgi:hypothetical protein
LNIDKSNESKQIRVTKGLSKLNILKTGRNKGQKDFLKYALSNAALISRNLGVKKINALALADLLNNIYEKKVRNSEFNFTR